MMRFIRSVTFRKKLLAFALVFGALTYLAMNKHAKSDPFSYHSEVWADKGGYYVHLPAFINYGGNANLMPDSCAESIGGGFTRSDDGKVITKYPVGTAVLQSPFYLAFHWTAPLFGHAQTGFEPFYFKSVNVAAAFWATVGLFALFGFLTTRFSKRAAWIATSLILAGTNVFNYTVDETGMSHIYSFALFSITLNLIHLKAFSLTNTRNVLLLGVLTGLIVIVRPTGVILPVFALATLRFDLINDVFKGGFSGVLKTLGLGATGTLIGISPQLLYLNYAFGSPFHYSYGEEGFDFSSPELVKTWFAAENGLFPYTPVMLIILIALGYMMYRKQKFGYSGMVLFFGLSYLFASWWDWRFGCSMGARNFVEYYALFAIPIAFGAQSFNDFKKPVQIGLILATVLCIAVNLQLTYAFDECFFGSDSFDYSTYLGLLKK